MNNYYEEAKQKLRKEAADGKFDRYANIMKKDVEAALEDFCRQDEEFAQAVFQGGTFEDCMKKVATNCGNGLSDLEAFRRAVQFYFRGADIQFQMKIDLVPHDRDDEETERADGQRSVVLNLADFL